MKKAPKGQMRFDRHAVSALVPRGWSGIKMFALACPCWKRDMLWVEAAVIALALSLPARQ